MGRISSSILFSLLLLQAPAVLCETPKDIFPKGYVNQGVPDGAKENRESSTKHGGSAIKVPNKPGRSIKEAPGQGIDDESGKTQPQPSPDGEDPSIFDIKGEKISAMHLAISPQDPDHFRKHLQDAIDLAEKHSIKIKNVLIIGNSNGILSKVKPSSLRRRDLAGIFRFLPVLPPPLNEIKNSPAFILEAQDGAIILEGPAAVAKYFNSKGEFVEPDLAVPQVD